LLQVVTIFFHARRAECGCLCTYGKDETVISDLKFFRFAGVTLANDGNAGEGVGSWIDFGCGCFEVTYFAINLKMILYI
jgi:hypothetical protein